MDAKEMKKLTKGRFGTRFLVFGVMSAFFCLFGSMILFLIGGLQGYDALLIAGGCVAAPGILGVVICCLPRKYPRETIDKLNNMLAEQVFGAERFIPASEIKGDILKSENIEPCVIKRASWSEFQGGGLELIAMDIFDSSVDYQASDNSAINQVLSFHSRGSGKARGDSPVRSKIPVPFTGVLLIAEFEPMDEPRVEFREIRDSINAADKKIPKVSSPWENIEIYTQSLDSVQRLLSNKSFISSIEKFTKVSDKGTAVILEGNRAFIEIFDCFGASSHIDYSDNTPGASYERITKKLSSLGEAFKEMKEALIK